MHNTYDVIVIGAGVAGLAAARELSNSGLRVAILEARERIGGRMYSIHDSADGFPIELGAEFIHGQPEATLSILREAGLQEYAVNGSVWAVNHGQFRKLDEDADPEKPIWEKMSTIEQDQSLQEVLDTYFSGEEWREGADSISSFVQGFDAARPDRVSIHWLLKEEESAAKINGHQNYRLSAAYDSVPKWLLEKCNKANTDLHLNTVVKEVHWQSGGVEIITGADGFRARRALITLPVGVLQAAPDMEGAVHFVPALTEKAWALSHIDMGQTVKVVLRFRERFWEKGLPTIELTDLVYLATENTPVRVWWTQNPNSAPTLTAWIGALEAAKLSGQSETAIAEQVIGMLATALGVERGWIELQLQEWHVHNWKADPFARGVYSYVAAGGIDAVRQLAEPIDNTLYFAGEATDMGWHIGTVHGAIASGQRAAREILTQVNS